MASYYEHNYAAFGAEVLRAPWMAASMNARATAILAMALSISPVDSGEYIDSFEITSGVSSFGGKGTRVYARLTNTSGHAAAVEFGLGRVPKYRVLGRSMHMGGGDVKSKYA